MPEGAGAGVDIALYPEKRENGYNIYHHLVDQWTAEAFSVDSEHRYPLLAYKT